MNRIKRIKASIRGLQSALFVALLLNGALLFVFVEATKEAVIHSASAQSAERLARK